MSRNIAKRFATMKLLYWEPVITGSGVRYNPPVVVRGFYLSNAQVLGGGVGDVIASSVGGLSENMVLFYLTEPRPEGYVAWDHTLEQLEQDGMADLSPDDIPKTHLIKKVFEYIMPGTKVPKIGDKAFFAQIQ